MELLFNHVARFSYHVTEQTAVGPDLTEAQRSGETDEAVVVKVCTESGDSSETVERAIEEIEAVSAEIGVETIVLFPWAHLSEDLAPPAIAIDRLTADQTCLEAARYSLLVVPFGWYKSWELESKGHPMSVLSRSV
jgi:threonyl-tRNA synthetase